MEQNWREYNKQDLNLMICLMTHFLMISNNMRIKKRGLSPSF